MEKVLKQIMGCFSFALIGTFTASAETSVVCQNQVPQNNQKELPNPEKAARRQTNKMKETLNLTDKQYKQIYKLNLKEEKAKVEKRTNQNMPPMPPMGQMGNGGNGMTPPMGPPPMDGDRMMEGGMSKPQPTENMQKQMEQKEKKFKKILTNEQYEKWKTMKPEKGKRPLAETKS